MATIDTATLRAESAEQARRTLRRDYAVALARHRAALARLDAARRERQRAVCAEHQAVEEARDLGTIAMRLGVRVGKPSTDEQEQEEAQQ